MNKIFAATIAAALAACFSSPALAQSSRDGTEDALKCLLRDGPPNCSDMFVGNATRVAAPWAHANSKRDFNRGALESSSFFGQASHDNVYDENVLRRLVTDDMDIYDVKYAHFEWTIYIGPAGADGKIRYLAIKLYGPHDPNQLRT